MKMGEPSLWFDVEKEKKTTLKDDALFKSMLWFDVEKEKKTTDYRTPEGGWRI